MSVQFTANDSYLTIGGTLDQLKNVAAATFAGWVNFSSFISGSNVLMAFSKNGATNNRMTLRVNSTGTLLEVGGRALDGDSFSILSGVTSLSTGVLYHVAGVIRFTTATGLIYLNGTLDASGSMTSMTAGNTSNTTSQQAEINASSGSSITAGAFEDFRVYNRELSASEIKELVTGRVSSDVNVYGLVGRYAMNEQPVGTAVTTGLIKDVSSKNASLTKNGTTATYASSLLRGM